MQLIQINYVQIQLLFPRNPGPCVLLPSLCVSPGSGDVMPVPWFSDPALLSLRRMRPQLVLHTASANNSHQSGRLVPCHYHVSLSSCCCEGGPLPASMIRYFTLFSWVHDNVMNHDKQSLIANSKPMIVLIEARAKPSSSQESDTVDCNWGHKPNLIVKFSIYWQGKFFRCLIQLIVRRIEVSLRFWAEVQLLAAPDKDWIKSCRS